MLAPGAAHPLLLLDLALVVGLRRVGLGAMMGAECTSGDCAQLSFDQCREPLDPAIAFTSVYSTRDGIVDWRACLDPAARQVEVRTSHLGMAVDPTVFDLVTATLEANRADRARAVTSQRARRSPALAASAG
jgi:hypothetical protein